MNVLKNSIIYIISNVLLKAFNFILLPLYTAYLATSEYGITNLANSFNAIAIQIVGLCLYNAIIRFYPEYKNDKTALARYYGTISCFVMISSIICVAAALLFRDALASFAFEGVPFFSILLLILINVPFLCQYTIYQDILRGMQKANRSAIISIVYFFVQVSLNIILLVIARLGATGVVLSSLLVNFIFTIVMYADLLKHRLIVFCIDKEKLTSSLKYSIPLIPHNLSASIADFISKVFLNSNFSLATVGIYGLASQFGMIADVIQFSVFYAYQPWFFDRMNTKSEGYKKEIVSTAKNLSWLYGIVFLTISLFCREVLQLITQEAYWTAANYIPFLVIAYALKTPYYFYVAVLFYYKKASKMIFIATLSSSILNVILAYILIPIIGAYGSIIAFTTTIIVRDVIVISMSKKWDDIGFCIVKTFFPMWIMVLCTLLGTIPMMFSDSTNLYFTLFRFLIYTGYIGLCFYSIKKSGELDSIKKYIRNKFGGKSHA